MLTHTRTHARTHVSACRVADHRRRLELAAAAHSILRLAADYRMKATARFHLANCLKAPGRGGAALARASSVGSCVPPPPPPISGNKSVLSPTVTGVRSLILRAVISYLLIC